MNGSSIARVFDPVELLPGLSRTSAASRSSTRRRRHHRCVGHRSRAPCPQKLARSTAQEINLRILCTSSPDQAMPATSSAVAHHLGIGLGADGPQRCMCRLRLWAHYIVPALVSSGVGNVLLIGAETMTRVTDWEATAPARSLSEMEPGQHGSRPFPAPGALLGYDLGVDGSLVESLHADHGSGMAMRGREIFGRSRPRIHPS